jgi:hypothetical protein
MFCSTIIPTVGRHTLTRAVTSVLAQDLGGLDFEIVVVNDSGRPLPAADWQTSPRVRLVDTQRHERSVARNTGAAIARGAFLHFLDDDDWLSPGALRRLAAVASAGDADWVYGHTQLVDRTGAPIARLRQSFSGNCFVQAIAGEWIPLQSSLIATRAFFAAGGFDPVIAGPEDVDVLRRIALRGTIACSADLAACISWGAEGSTTDWGRHAAQSRAAREHLLDRPEAFARMRASASSAYWHGRILRAYATSAVWNLERRRLLKAISRLSAALAGVAVAGPAVFSPHFWRAAVRRHASAAFSDGLRQHEAQEHAA